MPEADSKKPVSPRFSFGRILRLARPEWKVLALGTVFLILGQGTLLYFALKLKDIVDAASAGNMAVVNLATVTLLWVVVLGCVAMGLRSYCFVTSGERVVARLRTDLYKAILSQEIAFFDERRTGELMNRLSSDTTLLQSAVSTNISMVLRHTSTIVGGLGILLSNSPRLTLLMMVVVPPMALGATAYGRKVRKFSREVQDALARAGEVTEESISSLRTVRAFTAEKHEVERYARQIKHSFELARSRGLMGSIFSGITSLAGLLAVIAVLWYGSRLIILSQGAGGHALTPGSLLSFIAVTLEVAISLSSASELWTDALRASGAAERVFELMDRVPAMPLEGGLRPERSRGEVQFESVFFSYPSRKDVPVLKGMELTLREGEVVALVGQSGAGKSTIATLLTRFYDPDSGRVLLDGKDLRELDPSWLRQQIGIVAQEPVLLSCSIADNIRYGRPEATDAEVEACARTANAHDFVSRFPEGYNTLVGERGVQLSGGQKQRVAIARALLKDPRLLILDEATSALDAESEHLVKEALDRLMKGRSTLIIAHRLSTVMGADRVLVMDGGRVVQSGNHQALMDEDGFYRRLVKLQFAAA